jgi:Endonuclease/Exonuclease/phosphatase family
VEGTIRLAWWNLENLFDTDDDPISADLEFTVAQGWTPEAFAAKKANLAAVLRQLTADGPPELLGVAEVEGDDVFAELLDEVGEPNLQMVRDPGGTADRRGIDVSLAYDRRKLTVVEQHSHLVNLRYPPGTSSRWYSRSTTPANGWWCWRATGRPAAAADTTANRPGSRWPRTWPSWSATTSASTPPPTYGCARPGTWTRSGSGGKPRCC